MGVSNFAMNQPGWVWRAAVAVAAFILVLPLLMLAVTAMIAAAAVFGVLALIAMATARIRGARHSLRTGHRENVRVIVREQP